MPIYSYKAREGNGKPVKGVMQADTEEEVVEHLHGLGYMPTGIRKQSQGTLEADKSTRKHYRTKISNVIIFNLQIANLISAGIPLLKSLKTISGQVEDDKFRGVVDGLSESVLSGSSFSQALLEYPRIFTPLFIHMVQAGELSGNLATVLQRYAQFIEQQEEIKHKIRNALFYPVLLFIVATAVVIMIVTYIIPQFVEIFEKSNVALPLPTIILYKVGMGIRNYWLGMIFAFGAAVVAFKLYISTPKGRRLFDQFKLGIPVWGSLLRKMIVSRFSRTLATLLESGVPLLQSLETIKDVLGNQIFVEAVAQVRKSVEKGERLTQPIKRAKEFPIDLAQIVSAGEESGKLPRMLNKMADYYDTTVDYSIKKLITLIEPVFIIMMGIVVGMIMASIILPLFDLVKTIQR